jgi:ribonuclease D
MEWALEIRTRLKPVLENPNIVVVMFGAENDIKLLKRDFSIFLIGVVDIQKFQLGQRRQEALELAIETKGNHLQPSNLPEVLRYYLGDDRYKSKAHANKQKFQRYDWLKRPLPEDAKEYAVEDVFWLHHVWVDIKERV